MNAAALWRNERKCPTSAPPCEQKGKWSWSFSSLFRQWTSLVCHES